MRSCLFRRYMVVESDGFLMFPYVTDRLVRVSVKKL